MALYITNPEVEQEVRELARERGQGITDLIATAVRELRCRARQQARPRFSAEQIMALVRALPSVPVSYHQTEDEILGYGPNGY